MPAMRHETLPVQIYTRKIKGSRIPGVEGSSDLLDLTNQRIHGCLTIEYHRGVLKKRGLRNPGVIKKS